MKLGGNTLNTRPMVGRVFCIIAQSFSRKKEEERK